MRIIKLSKSEDASGNNFYMTKIKFEKNLGGLLVPTKLNNIFVLSYWWSFERIFYLAIVGTSRCGRAILFDNSVEIGYNPKIAVLFYFSRRMFSVNVSIENIDKGNT